MKTRSSFLMRLEDPFVHLVPIQSSRGLPGVLTSAVFLAEVLS